MSNVSVMGTEIIQDELFAPFPTVLFVIKLSTALMSDKMVQKPISSFCSNRDFTSCSTGMFHWDSERVGEKLWAVWKRGTGQEKRLKVGFECNEKVS